MSKELTCEPPPYPRGTGLALNTNTLTVLCPAAHGRAVKCVWGCRNYNGLCRLPHPETGYADPEKYTIGIDCLYPEQSKGG